MSMLIAPDTAYGKELWKWDHHEGEAHPSDASIRGMRPNGFRAFPAMLYRVTQTNPHKWESEVARDAVAQTALEQRGFVAGGLAAAAADYDRLQQSFAVAAAERNYADRRMSEAARAESDAAEQASSRHLGAIPETPIRRRGRTPKAAEPVSA